MTYRFKIEKTETEYLIIDTNMDDIQDSRIVARCSYINSSVVCDALNIQYNLTKKDRAKYKLKN